MNRKTFLRGLGVAGAGSLLIDNISSASAKKTFMAPPPNVCTLIPSETAGPYPLDLTENNFYFRQDIREDRAGVQHNVKMKIIGLENCGPMPNVRVNIWHCDKDGNYSGYGSETGKTYLRGYQFADFNGEVEFITIFPGWYNGRICHIHFQVYVSSVYAAISQFTYPLASKNAIYTANPTVYTKGVDPLSYNQDGIFADGYDLQLVTLEENATTGGFDSYLEVAIQGSGTTGLGSLEPETGGQFKLNTNYPNPFTTATTIPFTINTAAQVTLELYDVNGRKLVKLMDEQLSPGDYTHVVTRTNQGMTLQSGNYAYLLTTRNSNGVFKQAKLMTLL